MKFRVCWWISLTFTLFNNVDLCRATHWNAFASSEHYMNTRLVTQMANPFELLIVGKENPLMSTRILCSQLCANNATCWGFNFYTTNNEQVCEFFPENFCSHTKAVVLQVWPGGSVWDKLNPGKTKSCIEQKLNTSSTTQYCEILRPGCENTTSSITGLTTCSSCPRTCVDCAKINPTTADYYECTIWPEGPSEPPIFALCYNSAIYVLFRKVDPSSGVIEMDYHLTPKEMHRISRLNVYKTFYIGYRSSNNKFYLTDYTNFYFDADGSLMNMTFLSGGGGDGFNTGNTPLKPSPWVEASSSCGSFWFLNSTLTSATMQCPGGGIGILGNVDVSVSPTDTGIHWPKATAEGEILVHGDIKLIL